MTVASGDISTSLDGLINTGEPIIVSREGVLNEGQHRLTAVQRSGIGAVLDVPFGISREAFAATGTGARRTVGNVGAIAGKSRASMLSASRTGATSRSSPKWSSPRWKPNQRWARSPR